MKNIRKGEIKVMLSIPEVQYLRQVLPALEATTNPENELEQAANDLLQKRLYLIALNHPEFGGTLK